MANKRTFKKAARLLANSVSESLLVVYCNTKDADSQKVDDSIVKIFNTVDDVVARSNNYFGKSVRDYDRDRKAFNRAKHEFFKSLFNELQDNLATGINAAMKEFNAAIPQAEKDANKA